MIPAVQQLLYLTIALSVVVSKSSSYLLDSARPLLVLNSGGVADADNSLFGYSLDLLKKRRGSASTGAFLLAGAPKDLRDGELRGSFSVCSLDAASQGSGSGSLDLGRCYKREPDLSGAEAGDTFEDQMLGASVLALEASEDSRSQYGQAWTCAPRFQRPKEKRWPDELVQYSMMLGQCFRFSEQDQFRSSERHVPLEREPVFFGREGVANEYAYGTTYAQAGMALHAAPADDDGGGGGGGGIVFGAPGAWNWTGTVVVTDQNGDNPVMTQPWSPWEPRLNDYTGYAVTTGSFLKSRPRDGKQHQQQLVIGAPRAGSERSGSVFVVKYTTGVERVEQMTKLSGRQTGEYFGAALACVDINGDGIDEILVGAPLFSSEGPSTGITSKTYEEGRISIHQFGAGELSTTPQERLSIFGNVEGARFGAALASLGDMDGDGYQEFAVGAPYENEGGGAVRIFYGKADITAIQEAGQVIHAKDLHVTRPDAIRGLGISFSSAVDVDDNGIKDIAVGAHLSGSAVVLRSRPSVWVEIVHQSSLPSIDISDIQDFDLEWCVTLKSSSLPVPATLAAIVRIKSDPRSQVSSPQSQRKGQNELQLKGDLIQDRKICFQSIRVTSKPGFNPSSEELPLRFEFLVETDEKKENEASEFCPRCGILDPRRAHKDVMSVPFQSGCGGNDGLCRFDLSVSVDPQPALVIGSKDFLTLLFTVANLQGDPAFKPQLKIAYPSSVAVRKNAKECSTTEGSEVLLCDIPGPLKSGQEHVLQIDFDVTKLVGGQESVVFDPVEVFSASQGSKEMNYANNKVKTIIELETEVDLEISAPPLPERVPFRNAEGEMFKKLVLTHTYQVRKYLASPVDGVVAQVDVPKSFNGRNLVSVTSATLTFPGKVKVKAKCDVVPDRQRVGVGSSPQSGSSSFPHKLTCLTPGAACEEIRCPQFSLLSSDLVASVSVTMELSLPSDADANADADTDLPSTFLLGSEAHVALPDKLLESVPTRLDTRPNNAIYTTELFDPKTSLAGFSLWQLIASVVGALLLLLLFIVFLVWCGFFKRKKNRKDENGADEEEMRTFEQEVASKHAREAAAASRNNDADDREGGGREVSHLLTERDTL